MGYSPNAYKIYPRLCNSTDLLHRHIPRGLGKSASSNKFNGFRHSINRHIIEHDDVSLSLESFLYHIEILGFHLHSSVCWDGSPHSLYSRGYPSSYGYMVIFNHGQIVESHTVV